MQLTLELPEDIAQRLASSWEDLPRAALESLALEAYRSQALTAAELGKLLGFETHMQVDAFLKEHEVYDFTVANFEQPLSDRDIEVLELVARGLANKQIAYALNTADTTAKNHVQNILHKLGVQDRR